MDKDSTDSESTNTLEYVTSVTPELLHVSCETNTICPHLNYILALIALFFLLQIMIKLKMIHYKLCSVLSILSTVAFKIDHIFLKNKYEKSDKMFLDNMAENIPNLNFILDIIRSIDKKTT